MLQPETLHVYNAEYSLTAQTNGMDAHFLKRHQSAKVVMVLLSLNIERGIHSISLGQNQTVGYGEKYQFAFWAHPY
jgi:hypothetical protein